MKILKSTRHLTFTCDFIESLVLYWLSMYVFWCLFVDHTYSAGNFDKRTRCNASQ